ncbi:hypothetical protein [Actinospica sp.]|jgi:hypothetical protein|uniref:hypothetical protein n=1 Tax=Actinospica sp. TaxID=1872142 RepID=UPI002B7F35CE|nr:hypothetical protein [Actinospica sp.]HWG24917.1 hypothetical protein [Actinospica sp.]
MSNGMESLIHRDYAALVAAVPLIAAGAVATFGWRDRGPARAAAADEADSVIAALPQDLEYALIGVLLAVMAERLEHDPAAFPQLAGAASRLVPPAYLSGPHGWTGLTERARQAAVQVLRPTALSTLVRAASYEYLGALT